MGRVQEGQENLERGRKSSGSRGANYCSRRGIVKGMSKYKGEKIEGRQRRNRSSGKVGGVGGHSVVATSNQYERSLFKELIKERLK